MQKKGFITDIDNSSENMFIKYRRVRHQHHFTGKYRGAAYNICNLRYKTLNQIPLVFHNGSIYDYHFIIKELAKDFYGQFECYEKTLRNILLFLYQLKKNLIMVKKLRKSQSLLIVLDSCQLHYQVLLIISLMEFIMVNAKT